MVIAFAQGFMFDFDIDVASSAGHMPRADSLDPRGFHGIV